MDIRFEAARQDHEEDLESLFDWFSDDRSLRGHVRVERVAADHPGRMGTGLEAVLAVIATATGMAQLPLSYLAWRHSRRDRGTITFHIHGVDPAEADDILRRLRGDTGDDNGPEASGR
ncbi:hypothetical protein PV963_21860 [Streptomyces coeruleorubidus]|uniref:effector-associated constant component EACC1 n=1 Tax=Streptomyces coeruleorubidus TaxID=116188 RepID=UPI00237FC7A3|nr:hypothetical protein [Streptomyces coeruleorubidus]WDV52828.1 hypothetical protein PV963_21860 [Streptomyces coeruleorubidus]